MTRRGLLHLLVVGTTLAISSVSFAQVSRAGSWAPLTTGSDPAGTYLPESGTNRMVVCGLVIEFSAQTAVSVFTIGGETFDYSGNEYLNGAPDQEAFFWVWDEATIAAMSGSTISYTDDNAGTKQSWSCATYQDVDQGAAPVFAGNSAATVQSVNVTTTSTANDMIVGIMGDASNNRAPLDYETLTQQLSYNVADVAHGIADGAGGDGTTTFANDQVANSDMAALAVVLTAATTGGTDYWYRRLDE